MNDRKYILNRKLVTNGWNFLVYVFFPILLSRYLLLEEFFPLGLIKHTFFLYVLLASFMHALFILKYDESSMIENFDYKTFKFDLEKTRLRRLLNLHKFSLVSLTTENLIKLIWIFLLLFAIVNYHQVNNRWVDYASLIYYYYVGLGFFSGVLFILKTK